MSSVLHEAVKTLTKGQSGSPCPGQRAKVSVQTRVSVSAQLGGRGGLRAGGHLGICVA